MTSSSSSKSDARAKQAGQQVRTYLASLPPEVRREMKKIREIVRATAPGAVEVFSYGIPGFKLDGRPLVWYAAFKHHISLFPMTATIRKAHAAAIKGYKTSTGTIQFPLDNLPSSALIKRLVKARVVKSRKQERDA
jgi:uncharacterized protein YdhG (YjbR/CyaY superfamily)